MHDAMQIHWSRFANKAQWAMWVFYASMHEAGSGLGGIMFDDIGPNHRQGTALFVDSFIAQPPANDPNPAAWIDRMRFWTAVHEMGHAFNLAHSWQKSLGTPWVPLANEPEARSFMNYPYSVTGGQAAFFSNFEYRFSDQELLFIRHAPERFVQMGNADWFDHHGFEEAATQEEPMLTLEIRVNRDRARYEFMEPVWLELKLTNTGDQPRLVDADILDADSLTVILKKEGKEARQLVPVPAEVRPAGDESADAGRVDLRHRARVAPGSTAGTWRSRATTPCRSRSTTTGRTSSRTRCGSRSRRRGATRTSASRRTSSPMSRAGWTRSTAAARGRDRFARP